MTEAEMVAFGTLVGNVLEVGGRRLSPGALDLWWGALKAWPLTEVRAAVLDVLADPEQGRYPLTPAVVVGRLRREGDWLSADEAWGLALRSRDERESVCAPEAVLQAAAEISEIWESGDRVAARMAFKAAYERGVLERKGSGRGQAWKFSSGWDRERREVAAADAVRLGRLSTEQVGRYLPAPKMSGEMAAVAGLLTGRTVELPPDADERTRERLAALKEAIVGSRSRSEQEAARRREERSESRSEFERRRREALAWVADQAGNGVG